LVGRGGRSWEVGWIYRSESWEGRISGLDDWIGLIPVYWRDEEKRWDGPVIADWIT
jgi:hypothetical protein